MKSCLWRKAMFSRGNRAIALAWTGACIRWSVSSRDIPPQNTANPSACTKLVGFFSQFWYRENKRFLFISKKKTIQINFFLIWLRIERIVISFLESLEGSIRRVYDEKSAVSSWNQEVPNLIELPTHHGDQIRVFYCFFDGLLIKKLKKQLNCI